MLNWHGWRLVFIRRGLLWQYLAISWIPNIQHNLPLFIGCFGLSFFFVNFGPNATTFLIPSEIFPTNIRARAHGFSAAIGKADTFIDAFFLPIILKHMGLSFTMSIVAIAALLGIFASLLVPEMKGESLETTEIIAKTIEA